MSDNWLKVTPADPTFLPDDDSVEALLVALAELAPGAKSVEVIVGDHVELVDCGGNFELVRCPRCSVELDSTWWSDSMSAAWESHFDDLGIVVPCCRVDLSLNDLVYDWPQGFARWRVEARNPGRGLLDPAEVDHLRSALGCDIRVIWSHI